MSLIHQVVKDRRITDSAADWDGCTKYRKMAANVVKHAKFGKKV